MELGILAQEAAFELRARIDSALCALCLAAWLEAAQDAADTVFGAEVLRARGSLALLRQGFDAMARAAARGQVTFEPQAIRPEPWCAGLDGDVEDVRKPQPPKP